MIRTTRDNYAAVAATLALVLALGSGAAVAAKLITAKDIRDHAIKTRHVGFPVGTVGKSCSADVTSTGAEQILVRDTFKVDDAGMVAPAGAVLAENVTASAGTVELRLLVNGKVVGGTYAHVLEAGEKQTITIPITPGKRISAGKHAIWLEAVAGANDIVFRKSLIDGVISFSFRAGGPTAGGTPFCRSALRREKTWGGRGRAPSSHPHTRTQ